MCVNWSNSVKTTQLEGGQVDIQVQVLKPCNLVQFLISFSHFKSFGSPLYCRKNLKKLILVKKFLMHRQSEFSCLKTRAHSTAGSVLSQPLGCEFNIKKRKFLEDIRLQGK